MTEAQTARAVRPSVLPWARFTGDLSGVLAGDLSFGLAGGAEIALGNPGQRPIANAEPLGSFGGRRLPRGLVIGSNGRLYVADAKQRVIWTALASDGVGPRPADATPEWPLVPLWPQRPLPAPPAPHELDPAPNPPTDPYTLVRPVALALAPNGDLIIADAGRDGRGRLLVLTLPEGRMRHVIPLVEPVALSVDAQGRTCVADAGSKTIVRFDSLWRRDPDYPHASVPGFDGLTQIAHAHSAVCSCRRDCACPPTAQPDLWILARGKVHALTRDGFLWSEGALVLTGTTPATATLPDTLELLPPALSLAPDGSLSWRDPAFPGRDSLALPGLLVDRGGLLPGTRLALVARRRRLELPRAGTAQLNALDGEREGFAWDRVVLAGTVPERTRLLVSTATTDLKLDVSQRSALTWSAPLGIDSTVQTEFLIQSPPGRYLWLRIELFGDGASTPCISGIDVFGPRRSSLADLPVPFREDAESALFLDRFLSYFDTVFAEIVAQQRQLPALFDPAAVPAGPFLDWLGSWFDLTFLPEWPEATRRQMIVQAVTFYRRRGTVAGLRQMVQWHTGLADPAPAVIEHFRITQPISIAGESLAPTAPAHALTIVLPATAAPNEDARTRLEQVIAAAIPAHVRYELRLVTPGIAIGRQSTPGVDMLLGSNRPLPLDEARLGADAIMPASIAALALAANQGGPCPCQPIPR